MTSAHPPDGSPRRLRVGLASFAHVHAAGYAALLAARPDVELVCADPNAGADVAERPATDSGRDGSAQDVHGDRREVRGSELAERLGVRLVPSYDALFDSGLDAVVVCTESSRHRPLVERAAAAGVHVLCEKPLATRLEDALAMQRACAAAGVTLMTAYPVRFHPGFAELTAAVRRGDLGAVLTLNGTNNGQAPLAARRWFGDPELAGGGALMDHTVHLADLYDELLGPPAQVYAQVNRVLHAGEVEVETGGLVVLTYADGTVATIDCSWSAPATYPSWGGLTLAVEGTRGGAALDAFAERVDVFDDAAGGLRWDVVGPDLDSLMLTEFLDAVRSGRPAQPDGAVGVRTLEVVLAAYESARTGRPVALG